ncbi:MAG: hypothetical protein HY694_04840 [Deltaproteobacteria bacterium]|nr:hypothetical protein [Deltaproteobacteria bacterium]
MNSPKRLPVFKVYTVDARLREFRKADPSKRTIKFIPFGSRKGRKLLEKMETVKNGRV